WRRRDQVGAIKVNRHDGQLSTGCRRVDLGRILVARPQDRIQILRDVLTSGRWQDNLHGFNAMAGHVPESNVVRFAGCLSVQYRESGGLRSRVFPESRY